MNQPRQQPAERRFHPTDPFLGRMHLDPNTGAHVQIRPFIGNDLRYGATGRPGVDYLLFSEDIHAPRVTLTPEEYAAYEVVPRGPLELSKIWLYDWLEAQGVPMLNKYDFMTDSNATGVTVFMCRGPEPEASTLEMVVQAKDGRDLAGTVTDLLQACSIDAKCSYDGDIRKWNVSMPAGMVGLLQ